MIKNRMKYATVLMLCVAMIGCSNNKDTNVDDDLDNVTVSEDTSSIIIKTIEVQELGNYMQLQQISSLDIEDGTYSITYEVLGDESTYNRIVNKNTNVYSSPDKEANIIAIINGGNVLSVVALLEDSMFYKVVYNGRIAYIEADAINTIVNESIPVQNVTNIDLGTTNPSAGNTGTTNPSAGNAGTTNPSAGNSGATNPDAGNAGTTNPSAGNSGATNPDAGNSETTNPGTGNSEVTDSGSGNSGTTDSGVGDSGAEDSGTADSGVGDSGTTDSEAGDSGTTNSGVGDSGAGDSETTDSVAGD